MKKLFALFTACFLILAVPLPVYAQQPEIISTEIIPQADGGVLEITLTQDPVSARAAQTKSGTKTVSKKNASGQVVWSASLKGTFTYDGKKATCTASSVSVSIKNSTWKLSSKSAGKTGNKATGKVVMKQYYQNSVIDSVTQSITLSCSPSGALS